MSRREFRAVVEGPRPAAAWIMSLVASATLWVTEQLPWWIVAIQLVCYVTSYATRLSPPAIRRSPIFLNVLMAGITTVTIRSALDGNPATISLAYFTALAQGLQLLDARPRRSEFVLVALALFQVILASNLTDSVLFPPLLIVFLAAVTWTLLVHTLAMEAAEAGDPSALRQIVAPDLRRMTVWATAAALVLAGLLFVMMPRLKTHVLRGGVGPGLAVSGFSERVALGDVGRIRQDRSVVLRVESLSGEMPEPSESYWRGLAFDHFDGRNWAISKRENQPARRPVSGIGRFGITLQDESTRRDEDAGGPASRASDDTSATPTRLAQRILREPVDAGVLFTPGRVIEIEGPFQRLERDPNGGLYLPGRGDERIRYTLTSRATERDAERLRRDHARPPHAASPGGARPDTRYLQLPALSPEVHALAERLATEPTPDTTSDFERALAIRDYLRERGRYSDSPPPLGQGEQSPIEDFLLGRLEGHCEYFASAMVVLARSQGMPSRLVNGFAGGVPNDVGGFVEVTRADAHAWVEIHFDEAGWVRFDPTPISLRLRAEDSPSLLTRLAQLGSAIELWWFQRVVDFDSADQIGALRGLFRSWRDERDTPVAANERADPQAAPRTSNPLRDLVRLLPIAALALSSLLVTLAVRRNRREQGTLPSAYREALKLLARAELRRPANKTAREFVAALRGSLSAPGGDAFARITDAYLAERFGDRPAGDVTRDLAVLADAVDRMRLRNQTYVA